MNAMTITISREYGSGGRAIAQALSQELGIPCYDNEVISRAVKESGIGSWEFTLAENMRFSDFIYSMSVAEIAPHGEIQPLTYGERIFQAQSQALLQLADQGPAVFLGRCANYVLRGRPGCIHLFICGSPEARIRRAVESYGLKEKDAAYEVARMDKLRASYYGSNTGWKWGYGETYDLIINTDTIGVDGAVKLIKDYMALRG